MAILNVKGFPDGLYRKIQARARKERRSVAQQIVYLLQEAVDPPKQLQTHELKPYGRDFNDPWNGPAERSSPVR